MSTSAPTVGGVLGYGSDGSEGEWVLQVSLSGFPWCHPGGGALPSDIQYLCFDFPTLVRVGGR